MLKYDDFWLPDEKLAPIRHDIYHSTGPGYVVLKNYISKQFTDHMRAVWPNLPEEHMHQKFKTWNSLYYGMPNFERRSPGLDFFQNFFWNAPVCEITHAVALSIIILRNRIEGKPPTLHLAGELDQAAGYRMIFTKNQNISNPWHSDWEEEDTFDLSRIQATLFLSSYGEDYTGQAFVFRLNDGRLISMGRDAGIGAGDLILWRYRNEHTVLEVESQGDQIGFARMLFPPELLYRTPKDRPVTNGRIGDAPFRNSAVRRMTPKERADLIRTHMFGVELGTPEKPGAPKPLAGPAPAPAAAPAPSAAVPSIAAARPKPSIARRIVRKVKRAFA
jgi:hypothetical protein